MCTQLGVFILAAAMLVGCDTFKAREYRITRAQHGDAARVQRILRDVAAETQIQRSAPTPNDSPTIALYRDSKVQLRAGIEHSDIRVMLMRYDWPAPEAFRRADSLLVPALSETFGRRFKVEPPAEVETIIKVY